MMFLCCVGGAAVVVNRLALLVCRDEDGMSKLWL